jgi:hypothetical protein
MKIITKERIIKALEKSSRYYDAKPESHIVCTLAKIGIRSVCAEAFGQESEILEKERLELTYQGFTDPEKILKRLSHWNASRSLDSVSAIKEAWLHSWQQTLDQKWARDTKILAIQRKHGISGLDETEIDYGNAIVKHHEASWELELLDSDYEILKSERMVLAEAFVSAVHHHKMNLYKRTESEWLETTDRYVLAMTNVYQWAKAWEHRRYTNYRELSEKGFTTSMSTQVTPEHELEWEFHLSVGSGEPNTSQDSVWFCARIGRGTPSL